MSTSPLPCSGPDMTLRVGRRAWMHKGWGDIVAALPLANLVEHCRHLRITSVGAGAGHEDEHEEGRDCARKVPVVTTRLHRMR